VIKYDTEKINIVTNTLILFQARISQDQEHFLINPFGMTYSEITASSLVKIDLRGEVIDPGATTLGVNQAGFTLHSAIHQFRPDIKCIIHLHTPSVVAVSILFQVVSPLNMLPNW
jgi:adducin